MKGTRCAIEFWTVTVERFAADVVDQTLLKDAAAREAGARGA
jgi:hypothetical protein